MKNLEIWGNWAFSEMEICIENLKSKNPINQEHTNISWKAVSQKVCLDRTGVVTFIIVW